MKEKKRPVVMDFTVYPLEGVYPMVPAGQPISNMLLGLIGLSNLVSTLKENFFASYNIHTCHQ